MIIILLLFYQNNNLQVFPLKVGEIKSTKSRKAPEKKLETNIVKKYGLNLHDAVLFASNYPLPRSKGLWEQKQQGICRQFNLRFVRNR